MEFLRILGFVFLFFIGFFCVLATLMFMIAGPTIMHTIIGIPISLIVLSGCIYGVKKLIDSDY